MIMLKGNLGFSPEFEEAKAELQTVRAKYVALVEAYSHLRGVVGKNLETEYMLKIGRKEHELFSCRVEILRLRREIAIFQAARNCGETITAEAVKTIIEKEFSDYKEQLEKQKAQLEQARSYMGARHLNSEESKVLKKTYHDIVRKLHPDLHPGLPKEALELWQRVQDAYQMNDWDELYVLADMVDEVLAGKADYVESIDSLSCLRNELAKTNQKISELEAQIKRIKECVPFVYEALLNDPKAVVEKRHELDEYIKSCKAHLEELKELRQEFGA